MILGKLLKFSESYFAHLWNEANIFSWSFWGLRGSNAFKVLNKMPGNIVIILMYIHFQMCLLHFERLSNLVISVLTAE